MTKDEKRIRTTIYALGSLIGWTAIILQLYVTISIRQVPLLDVLIRFFSYFTILTNILVALHFSCLWLFPLSNFASYFKKFTTKTALMVYILVVGLIYNLLLRGIWTVTGLAKLADELLHSFIPSFFIIYWIFFSEKEKLNWKDALSWVWYPIIYLTYTLLRGVITNTYPYPFIDVTKLGYQQVIINSLGIGFLFYLFFIIAIAVSRNIFKIQSHTEEV